MNNYQERLYNEWKTHGKILIAADWDSTIEHWPTIVNDEDRKEVIELLQAAYNIGAYITIWTACKPDRFEEIQKRCDELKIPISSINKNPIDLPYGNHGKIFYNILLDDRAGLLEAMNNLRVVMNEIMTDNSRKLTLGEHA